jgi:hypothetical protein
MIIHRDGYGLNLQNGSSDPDPWRLAITTTDPPPVGHQITLTLPARALQDPFLNHLQETCTQTLTWPAADAVLADRAAPTVRRLTVRRLLRFLHSDSEVARDRR